MRRGVKQARDRLPLSEGKEENTSEGALYNLVVVVVVVVVVVIIVDTVV